MLFVIKIDKAASEDLATPSIDEAKKKLKKQSKRNTIKWIQQETQRSQEQGKKYMHMKLLDI